MYRNNQWMDDFDFGAGKNGLISWPGFQTGLVVGVVEGLNDRILLGDPLVQFGHLEFFG